MECLAELKKLTTPGKVITIINDDSCLHLMSPVTSQNIPSFASMHCQSKRDSCIVFTKQNYYFYLFLVFFLLDLLQCSYLGPGSWCTTWQCLILLLYGHCFQFLLALAQPVLRIGSNALHQLSPILGFHSSLVMASASICACAACGVAGGFRANIKVVCTRRRFASGSPPCMSGLGAPRLHKA